MRKRAFIFIVLAGILWGTSGIFVNLLAPFGISSFQMTFFRALVSFISMSLYAVICNRQLFKVKAGALIIFAFIGLSFFGTASCYYISLQMTSISTAVVLMYLAPVLVMIYSVIFMGEKLTVLKTVSVLAMFTGCGLVSGIIGGMEFNPLGIAIGVLSGISYAAYNIFTKIAMKNKNNPVSANLYCFLFAAVISFFACKPMTIPGIISQNPAVILSLIIGMGICTCILPYLLYTIALKDLPVGTAAALGIVEPMAATVFSVVLFKEQLGLFTLIGIVLILAAIFLLSKSEDL